MAFADVPAVAQLGTFAVAGVLGAAAATRSAVPPIATSEIRPAHLVLGRVWFRGVHRSGRLSWSCETATQAERGSDGRGRLALAELLEKVGEGDFSAQRGGSGAAAADGGRYRVDRRPPYTAGFAIEVTACHARTLFSNVLLLATETSVDGTFHCLLPWVGNPLWKIVLLRRPRARHWVPVIGLTSRLPESEWAAKANA